MLHCTTCQKHLMLGAVSNNGVAYPFWFLLATQFAKRGARWDMLLLGMQLM